MSLNNYEQYTDASYDYFLGFKKSDFIYSKFSSTLPKLNCQELKSQNPCSIDDKTIDCMNEKLCYNRELGEQAIEIINTNNESQKRQWDSSMIYDNAVQTCIAFSTGMLGMFIFMYISVYKPN